MKYTPGPWWVSKIQICGTRIVPPEGPIYFVDIWAKEGGKRSPNILTFCEKEREETLANAHLIAAAPDLLEALKNVISFLDPKPTDKPQTDAYVLAIKTIAKAEGMGDKK